MRGITWCLLMISMDMGVYPEFAPWVELHSFIFYFLIISLRKDLTMKNFIIAIIAAFFCFSFYSFMFSKGKDAAENVSNKVSITSVDKACKQSKELCKEL